MLKESEKIAEQASYELETVVQMNEHIISSMRTGIIVIKNNGLILMTNNAALELLGLGRRRAGHVATHHLVHALEAFVDLRAAAARVQRAAAEAKITGADLMPTVGAGLSWTRQRINFIGFDFFGNEEVMSNTFTNYGLSLDTTWEVDLWGRIRSGQSAAWADAASNKSTAATASTWRRVLMKPK